MTPAEIQKRVREKRKENGLCVRCIKPSRPGKSYCLECTKKSTKYVTELRGKKRSEINSQTREMRRISRANNACVRCDSPSSLYLCKPCSDRSRIYSSNTRNKNVQNGKCKQCGRPNDTDKLSCSRCQKMRKIYNINNDRYNRENRWNHILFEYARNRAKKKGFEFSIEVSDIPNPRGLSCPVFGWPFEFAVGHKVNQSATVDRIDSSMGYVPGNIQLLSSLANSIKSDAPAETILAVANAIIERESYPVIVNDHDPRTQAKRQRMVTRKKVSNKRGRGLEFSLNWYDFSLPKVCPCTGIKLNNDDWRTRPSMDRINNLVGYIPGNVWVISAQANAIKSNANGSQIMQVYEHMISNSSNPI